MKNKEILRKIYYGNRAINRNIQRLANISLIGLLARSAKNMILNIYLDPHMMVLFWIQFLMMWMTKEI